MSISGLGSDPGVPSGATVPFSTQPGTKPGDQRVVTPPAASGVSGQPPPDDAALRHLRGAAPPQVAVLPRDLPSAKDLRVTIIDQWDTPSVSVSRSHATANLSHGQMIEEIIRRGLPDATYTRVDASKAQVSLAQTVSTTLESTVAQQSKAQGVSADRVDLRNVVVNVSQSQSELSANERTRLTAAVAAFTARGGRIYIAAGNNQRNPLIDIPGVIGVDGSNGVIGEPAVTRPSAFYNNGDVPVVQNSLVDARHDALGRVRIGPDSNRVLPPGSESAPPPAPFAGRRLADVLIDEKAVARPLQRYSTVQQQLFDTQIALERPMEPGARASLSQQEQRLTAERTRLAAQIERIGAGKLIRVSMAPTDNENYDRETFGREVLPKDIDRRRVFVTADHLLKGIGLGGRVLYEADARGLLRPLSAPGKGLRSSGTSWASANELVEREVERLARQQGRPAIR
jgi:hypothetical protein